jgi:hypothetical protein
VNFCEQRNRQIVEALAQGRSLKQLCLDHNLTIQRITAIVTEERNKRAVSPELYYRALRSTLA